MYYDFFKITGDLTLKNFIDKFEKFKNKKNTKIAIKISKNKKVEGIISLGDLRRILSKENNLNKLIKHYFNKNYFHIYENELNSNLYSKIYSFTKKKSDVSRLGEIIVIDKKKNFKNVLNFEIIDKLVKFKKTCIVGLGHIGLPLLLYLSTKFDLVNGFDLNSKKINRIYNKKIDFYERGLDKILDLSISQKKINLSSNLYKIKSEIYIICLGTEIVNNKVNNNNINSLAKNLSKVLKKNDLIILRGTVQVGFTRNIFKKIIEKETNFKFGRDLYLGFMPERLVEGNAVEEIKSIPQVYSGLTKNCKEIMSNFVEQTFQKFLLCDSLEEAELIKLTSNAYRDLNFSFSNQVSKIANKFGFSGSKMIEKANYGYQRNQISMPSVGVGGFCLTKDPKILNTPIKNYKYRYILSEISRKANVDFLQFNKNRVLNIIKKNILKKKIKVLIFGIAFKSFPENIDTRNSIALDVGKYLRQNQIDCYFTDKLANKYDSKILKIKIIQKKINYNMFDAILIINKHDDFLDMLNNSLSINKSKFKKIIFDPWNILDKDYVRNINWEYFNI